MVTKKRKATTKVKEAAPTYTARSRRSTTKLKKAPPAYNARSRVRTGKAKQKPGAQGEALWQVYLTLPEDERGAFIEKMLDDRERREDIMDICIVIARKGEPKRPFEEFVAELERERRK